LTLYLYCIRSHNTSLHCYLLLRLYYYIICTLLGV